MLASEWTILPLMACQRKLGMGPAFGASQILESSSVHVAALRAVEAKKKAEEAEKKAAEHRGKVEQRKAKYVSSGQLH